MEGRVESKKEAAEMERLPELEKLSEREAILTLETKLRIEAAKIEIEGLEKRGYLENQKEIEDLKKKIKELRKEKLGDEAKAERALAKGFHLEVEGFTKEIKKVAEKKEVKQIIKDLEEAEKKEDQTKIEEKRIALKEFTKEMPWLDDEEIKILLLRLLPSPFHKFFENHCKIVYDPSITEDSVSPPTQEADKIVFTFGPKALFETLEHVKVKGEPTKIIKPGKLAFQIGRMLGAFLNEPSNWDKVAKNIEIEKGKAPSWEDFVGLCLTSPQTARDLSEPAYEHFVNCLQELSGLSAEEIKEKFKYKEEGKSFEKVGELVPGKKEEGRFQKILKSPFRSAANTFSVFFRRLAAIYDEKLIWYDMTLSRLEVEEAKLITERQEHISDRDRRLWLYLMTGDKLGARGLILADATTADSRWWRYHTYLYMFDPLYRWTKGEQINRESYDFLVRCTRTSHGVKRSGSKMGEYKTVVLEDGRKIYQRMDRKEWLEAAEKEINKLTLRQVLTSTDEAFEWMQHEGRFWEFDEEFEGNTPLAFREGWTKEDWQKEKSSFETNYLEKINLPSWFINKVFKEGKRPIAKWDADQVALCARLTADHEISEAGGVIGGLIRAPFKGAEHARVIQKEMVQDCQKKLEWYKEWKERTGQKIEDFENLIWLIDVCKKKELRGYVDTILKSGEKSDLKILRDLNLLKEIPAPKIPSALQQEPNIKLHRSAEETEKTYGEVKKFKVKEEEIFQKDIQDLPINLELKKHLKENPSLLLDLLVHSDVTSQEVAKEILKGVTKENLPKFQKLTEEIQSSIPVLGKYFNENQERIVGFLKTYDWVENNDLKAFLEAYEEKGTTYEDLKKREEEKIEKKQKEEIIDKIGAYKEAGQFEEALNEFKKAFPEKAKPEILSVLKPENIIPVTETICEEERKKMVNRENLLKKEKEFVQDALKIFPSERVKIDPEVGLTISPALTEEEKIRLSNLVNKLAYIPNVDKDGELDKRKIWFVRAYTEEARRLKNLGKEEEAKELLLKTQPIRTYSALKALEAALLIELTQLAVPREAPRVRPARRERPGEEEERFPS